MARTSEEEEVCSQAVRSGRVRPGCPIKWGQGRRTEVSTPRKNKPQRDNEKCSIITISDGKGSQLLGKTGIFSGDFLPGRIGFYSRGVCAERWDLSAEGTTDFTEEITGIPGNGFNLKAGMADGLDFPIPVEPIGGGIPQIGFPVEIECGEAGPDVRPNVSAGLPFLEHATDGVQGVSNNLNDLFELAHVHFHQDVVKLAFSVPSIDPDFVPEAGVGDNPISAEPAIVGDIDTIVVEEKL